MVEDSNVQENWTCSLFDESTPYSSCDDEANRGDSIAVVTLESEIMNNLLHGS